MFLFFFKKKIMFFCCSCSIGFLVFRFIIIISSLLFPLICILSSSFCSPRFSCCLRVGGFCFGFAAVRKKKRFVVVDIALMLSVATEELTLELLLEYLSRFKRHIYQRPDEKPPGGIRFLLMI